jgi:hypothetical protein
MEILGLLQTPEGSKKKRVMGIVCHLANIDPVPWLCIGDFNEIVNLMEMKEGLKRARRQMVDFQEALEDSQLCDLGFKGPKYM